MIRSLRGPLIALISAALAVVVLSRIGSSVWVSRVVADAAASKILPILWFNFLVELAVLVVVFFAVKWLIDRDRSDRSAKARLDHLADVAAMSGGFAHEARNLLNALQTRIELLRKHLAGNEKAGERVDKIEELASDMEQLFTDFLTLARPAEDHLEETDVATLIGQVLEFEQLELERSGVTVVCDFDPQTPPALVDRGKLKRAILNLIVNARHAMSEGGELKLRVKPFGKRVLVEVEDSGCGIPQDDQPRIFQTYFTTKSEGTGLGLAIVRRTVEDFGGKVSFTSTAGVGTTFTIILLSVRQHRAAAKRMLNKLPLGTAAR
jgi:signal transduction histidine kinase